MLSLQKEDLQHALSIVSKAISPNPILPLLGNILLEVDRESVCLSATSIELGISYTMTTKTASKPFKTCIPARTFLSLVEAVYAPELQFNMDTASQSLQVTTENSRNNVKCVPSDEFPDIPQVYKANIVMNVSLFKQMVNRVAFSAKVNDTESTLSGVLFLTEKSPSKKFLMFAADGYHISYEEATEDIKILGTPLRAIVRASVLELVSKVLPSEGTLKIQVDDNKMMFQMEGLDVLVSLMGGDFPDYRMLQKAIPKPTTTLIISTMDMLRACRQLRVFANDSGASKMEIAGAVVNYSTMSQARGDSNIALAAMRKGKDLSIGINVRYMLMFLQVCSTEQTVIEMAGESSPIVFRMKDFPSYYHVIMPIKF